MLYYVYNAAVTVAFVMALPVLPLFFFLGERFRSGFGQRLALYSSRVKKELSGSRPIWIHAASVGEVLSAGRLVQELKGRFPQRKIVLSTFTNTGHRMASEAMAADVVIFLPLDLLWVVRRSLIAVDPSVLIFLETEIWPNFLQEAHRKGIPTLLLSGRLSARGLRRYAWFGPLFKSVIRCFTAIGMQSEEDAERMMRLGAEGSKISVVGSLKRAALNRHGNSAQEAVSAPSKRNPRGNGRMLVVGSSHRGEEQIMLNVFSAVKSTFPDLRLVLAPRHPQRFGEVENLLKASGVSFEKMSQVKAGPYFDKDVMLVDTLGDLPGFYAIGDLAFVGGSFVDAGGHNLLEPARFRKPVLFGPYTTNFRSLAAELKQKGGGIEVRDAESLIREITDLLMDTDKRKLMGEKAHQIAADDHGVMERNLALVSRYLQPERIE